MRKLSAYLGAVTLIAVLFLVGCGGSSKPPITVSLSPSTTQNIDQGQSVNVTATLTNDTTNAGVTWGLTGAGTLANQTSTSATYDAPSSVSSSTSVTVTATSVASGTADAQVSITVDPAPQVTTTSLPAGTEGTAYSTTLGASGGTGAYTWAVSSGSLPSWASLSASTGVITGTPNATSTTNFAVTVTDAAGVTSAAQALTLTINAPPPLAISTTTLPGGTEGTSYSTTLSATGGIQPYTWSVASGSLPAWANLNASTGVISGMPNASGTSTFTVKVTDSEPTPVSITSGSLSIAIAAAPALAVSTASLPTGTENTPYTTTLAATGGVQPYTWAVASGSLPSWASLDTTTGVISGTPNATSTTTFTVNVTDSEATPVTATSGSLTLTINAPSGTNDAELKGQYAFLLQGFNDSTGNQFAVVGSLTADGSGNVQGMIDENGPTALTATSVSGTYSIGSDNRGTISLNISGGSTLTLAVAVGTLNSSNIATRATMIEFDDTTGTNGNRGSGNLFLQDSTKFNLASISGPYAFQFVGQENSAGTRQVNTGAFSADGNGNITNGELDSNSTGTVSNSTFTATISADANTTSFGRVTLTLGGGPTGAEVSYIVDGTRMLSMTTGSESTSGLTSGEIRAQSTTSFSTSSLNGVSVLAEFGLGSTAGDASATVGLITWNGSGSVSVNLQRNDSGTTTAETGSYTYTVAANGRVSIATGSGHQPILYLVGSNSGFLMSTGGSTDAGFFFKQSSGTFSTGSVSGNYFIGVTAPTVIGASVLSGVGTSTGNGTVTSTLDGSSPSGLTTAQSFTSTLTIASNGSGTDTLGDVVFLISSTKAIYMNTTNPAPTITIVQQ